MSSQTKLIKDIFSLYNTILENKEMVEAEDVYDNVEFKNSNLGNPSSDSINTTLLQDVQKAAKTAGVNVTITTAISGHRPSPRHDSGNAVDISIINGKSVSPSNRADADKLVNALVSMGYTKNVESSNDKAVLTFGFEGHDDHVHVSNKGNTSTPAKSDSITYKEPVKVDPMVAQVANSVPKSLGLSEGKVYSKFGERTQSSYGAIIIPKDSNPRIKSPVSGTIVRGNYNSSCSNQIVIKHSIDNKEFYLEYCGISHPSTTVGDKVNQGSILGSTDSDVQVSLFNSRHNRDYIDNYINKNTSKDTEPSIINKKSVNRDNETMISKLLQLPFKPFKNQYDSEGNMIEKRFGSPTSKEQPVDWINRLSPTYKKKVTENIDRIKGLLK
jgi:hypothetical protein